MKKAYEAFPFKQQTMNIPYGPTFSSGVQFPALHPHLKE